MSEKPVTLYEKAAQLVFARTGSNMEPPVTAEADADRVAALVDRCPLGGLILFNGHASEIAEALAHVQAVSRFPLLVGSDIERGAGQQLAGATVFPHARAFGAVHPDTEGERLVEAVARATAREARACGLHIAFAPVADVHLNPRNPIISTRAFSEDPERVARLVRAYVRGCQAEGFMATVKHFPGHGRTAGDSHAELPVVETSREELERTDLLPFRRAVEAGVDFVMTAHVAFPVLGDATTPATHSRPILHGLLREQMGFKGLVVTDSLLMEAVRSTPEEAGRQAAALIEAGVDVLLDPDDPEGVVEGLVHAVEEGRLSEARLGEAWRRVWALKEHVQARHPAAYRPSAEAWAAIDRTAHEAVAHEVAGKALTVLEATPGAWPFNTQEDLLVVRVDPKAGGESAAAQSLERLLKARIPGATYRVLGPQGEAEDVLQREAREAGHVVLVLVVEPAAWHRYGLQPAQAHFVQKLAASRDVVAAALGSPHVLDEVPRPAVRLCTYSDTLPAQAAFVEALAGNCSRDVTNSCRSPT